MAKRSKASYMISAVALQYELHPQTLRLYEREGLLKPSRSDGNTRLYTDEDLAQLEVILSLTRDLGVNLAGVEIILNMRAKMEAMQRQFERFFHDLQNYADDFASLVDTDALSDWARGLRGRTNALTCSSAIADSWRCGRSAESETRPMTIRLQMESREQEVAHLDLRPAVSGCRP